MAKIVYTLTDERAAGVGDLLLPCLLSSPAYPRETAGWSSETRDISLAGRIVAALRLAAESSAGRRPRRAR